MSGAGIDRAAVCVGRLAPAEEPMSDWMELTTTNGKRVMVNFARVEAVHETDTGTWVVAGGRWIEVQETIDEIWEEDAE